MQQASIEVREGLPAAKPGERIVVIDGADCIRKADAFIIIGAALDFPYYFNQKWASFDECLHDLDWQQASRVVLVIENAGQVMSADEESFSIFARTLAGPEAEYPRGRLVIVPLFPDGGGRSRWSDEGLLPRLAG